MTSSVDTLPITVVWFRHDLRIDDHRPLKYAAKRGRVVPVYVADSTIESASEQSQNLSMGKASQWWLHHSLQSLAKTLESLGSPLILRTGSPLQLLQAICKQVEADQIAIHESTDPTTQSNDDVLEIELDQSGIELVRFQSDILWPIGSVLSGSAKPYRVFTPF